MPAVIPLTSSARATSGLGPYGLGHRRQTLHQGQGQPFVDQNFDNYSVEYTYADGTKLMHYGRTIEGCHNELASYVHGTKGFGTFSINGHWPAPSNYTAENPNPANEIEIPVRESNSPDEWEDLLDAIRNDKPYNAERGALASQVCNMRMAVHTGQRVMWDDAMNADLRRYRKTRRPRRQGARQRQ